MNLRQYKNDIMMSCFLFIAIYTLFFMGCSSLLNSGFYSQMNIAFDFDQNWFFDFVGRPHDSWLYKTPSPEIVLSIKHPLIYLYHYTALCLQALGVSVEHSVIAISLFFHTLSAVVVFVIFRLNKVTIANAFCYTAAYAFSATYLVNGLVLDSYTLVSLWITLIFLGMVLKSIHNFDVNVWLRAVVAAFAVGTTLYLLVLIVISELYLAYKREGHVRKVLFSKSLYIQALRVSSLLVLAFAIIYHDILYLLISDPVGYFKSIYWAVQRPGEKSGFLQVVTVFTTFTLIAPDLTAVTLAGGAQMSDFREFKFSIFGWIGFISCAVIVLTHINRNSEIKLFSLLWLVICILFHMKYQDRGSLFLYTGHFLLAVWLIYFLQKSSSTYLQMAKYTVLSSIVINNGLFLVTFFDVYTQ